MKKILQKAREIHIRAHKRFKTFHSKYPGFNCMIVDKSSFLSMYKEIFERGIYRFHSENPAPYIIDCGANIGLTTIFLKKIFPKARITAFEPDETIFAALEKNITTSASSDRVTLINKGLWSSDGTLSFFAEGADGGRVATSEDHEQIKNIEVVRLSTYLNEAVDFLKIDIEGSELDVLEESKAKLTNVKNIFIEYHSLHSKDQVLQKILDILAEAGFRYYIESTGISSKHPLECIETHLGYDNQLNIFGYRI